MSCSSRGSTIRADHAEDAAVALHPPVSLYSGARPCRSRPTFHRLAILASCLLLLWCGNRPAAAQDAVRIREIVFEGNQTTRPQTMLREMLVQEGADADPALIERSRQAVLDLGLFRFVDVRQELVEGGVRLVFTVKEKWYLLPYPRLSANSDGQNSAGAELRWNNIWGLNHSLRLIARSRDSGDTDRGREISYRAGYQAPFLLGSGYGLNLNLAHSITPITEPAVYDELIDEAQVLVTHHFFSVGPASQGWTWGSGLLWRKQNTEGDAAPPPYGQAKALVGQLDYRNVRFKIYSEEGNNFSARYEVADRHYGSDYSYTRVTADWDHSHAVGLMPHQTFELGLHLGLANNGPAGVDDFSLGGAAGLRGYARKSFEGDFYYLASAQYLRPLHWDWLRLAVGIEAGNAHVEADTINAYPQISLNLGLRVRLTRFVNFDFEAGFAMPMNGDGARFYADRGNF